MSSNNHQNLLSSITKEWESLSLKRKHTVWAEINLKALTDNIAQVRNLVGSKVNIMAVVKADAYGHGAVAVANKIGHLIDYFGVSRISEAMELRLNAICKPILIFGYTPPDLLDMVLDLDISQTVHSFEMAKEYSVKARKLGEKIKVHIKLDTGMGRLGIFLHNISDIELYKKYFSDAVSEVEAIAKLPGIEVEGIYTHLSTVDTKDIDYAQKQLVTFAEFLLEMDRKKIFFKLRHAAGTFALLNLKGSYFDMVRVGKAIYGILPEMPNRPELKFSQALTVKSTVSHIKTVPEGVRISYAGAGITKKDSKIATVPMGFADGYIWQSVSTSCVLINGIKVPVVGRICMDFLMVDVSNAGDISIGDEVVVTGMQLEDKVLLTTLASNFGSTPSSLATFFTARTPKIMLE